MLRTAYDIVSIAVHVVIRLVRLCFQLVRWICGGRRQREGEGVGSHKRIAAPKAAARSTTVAQQPEEERVEDRQVRPERDEPSEEDPGGDSPQGEPGASRSRRMTKIVTRNGAGFRVHFYFDRANRRVRRSAMFDFKALRERFGVIHANDLRLRLGFRPTRQDGRVRETAFKWARLALPDVELDVVSPYEIAAITMMDRTMSEVERFVTDGQLPGATVVDPRSSGTPAKTRGSARKSADADAAPQGVVPAGADALQDTVRRYAGLIVSKGLAPDSKNRKGKRYSAFYADIETDGKVVRHTGADLERALKEAGAGEGDRVEITLYGTALLAGGAIRKKLWSARLIAKGTPRDAA